jgi:hypothetical protein
MSARTFWLVTAFVVTLAPAHAQERARAPERVVLISIDGLRPDFYESADYEMPNVRSLAARGASALGVEAVFPSLTYPGHASVVTGVRPARHGIVANTHWSEGGARPEWFWETKDLHAKTLWQAAHEQGRRVAITQWPSTVGAQVDWLVPERWGLKGESTRDLLLKTSTPGLLFELAMALGIPDLDSAKMDDRSKIDEFVAGSAAYLLRAHGPTLVLAHLIEVDEVEHGHGRDGPEVRAAVKHVDACIGKIVDAAKEAGLLESTVFAITGDHGFTDVTFTVAPNVYLARAGLVSVDKDGKLESWRALGHAFGGSMGIHARDAAAAQEARSVLERNAVLDGRRLYRIVEKDEAAALGADPEIAFWLDAGPEVGIGGAWTGPPTTAHGRYGTHGGLPTKPQLATGFVVAGPGIRRTVLERMRLIDIAPTLARLLRIDLPDTDGGVVRVLDEDPD